jgi:glutamate decarboxylase
MPENSIPKEAAYQIINDELMLDGNPRLNLASFCTTWMEPECDKLIMASINKNYVDMDEYPVTTELQVHNQTLLCFALSVEKPCALSFLADDDFVCIAEPVRQHDRASLQRAAGRV